MARYPVEIIRSVLDRIDIVDFISRFVTLKRSGSSQKGLCPFHDEKTPSFHVFPSSGRYKCFGCGESGDALGFLMKRGNIGFRDAIEELANEAGVSLPTVEETPAEQERHRQRSAALKALDFAAGFYRALYARDAGASARDYMSSRGYDESTVETFGIGFSPDSFEGLMHYARQKGFSEDALLAAGLLRRNEQGRVYDMFRGRIMFPIHDLRGQVIGFGARAMGDDQPKYLNSPDGPLFHKSREMYGLVNAREPAVREGRLLVVEGYTDVMSCWQAGLREVAAGLGTALTPDNARQLRRFNVPVLLVYDGDEAGRRAAERAADVFLAEQVEGAVALLPPGNDPADLVTRKGREGLEQVLEGSQDLWEYRMQRALERHDATTLDGGGRAVDELMGTIAAMGDPLRKDLALKSLAEQLGVPELTLRDQVSKTNTPRRRNASGGEEIPSRDAAWRRAEEELVAAILCDDAVWDRVEETYPPEEWVDRNLATAAGAVRNLRARGESVTREGLLAELADEDGAIRALQAIETPDQNEDADKAKTRALRHLDRIADRKTLRSAAEQQEDKLKAVVRARRGFLNEDS